MVLYDKMLSHYLVAACFEMGAPKKERKKKGKERNPLSDRLRCERNHEIDKTRAYTESKFSQSILKPSIVTIERYQGIVVPLFMSLNTYIPRYVSRPVQHKM